MGSPIIFSPTVCNSPLGKDSWLSWYNILLKTFLGTMSITCFNPTFSSIFFRDIFFYFWNDIEMRCSYFMFTYENCPEIELNILVLSKIWHKKCLVIAKILKIYHNFGTIFLGNIKKKCIPTSDFYAILNDQNFELRYL